MYKHKKRKSFSTTPMTGDDFAFIRRVCHNMGKRIKKNTFLHHVSHEYIMDISDISLYNGPEWKLIAQYQAIFKKNVAFILDRSVPAEAAKKVFFSCEDKCKETNLMFELNEISHPLRIFLNTARHYVQTILRDVPKHLSPDFGPGASFELKGEAANINSKLKTIPSVTQLAHDDVLYHILDSMPHYAISSGIVHRTKTTIELYHRHLPLCKGNRFLTVPKTAKIDRPICVEPLGNMLIQKAYGKAIRSRLLQYGHDINMAPELHQKLVHIGSIDGTYASIDLSSASDTISSQLVKYLLPVDWYDALNRARSHYTLIDNQWIHNEKFSSMGNGFTFELETLLFYCLCLAVARHKGYRNKSGNVSTFGDDIIVPTELAETTIWLLESCGFSVNEEKTFISGFFRESCGQDYYNGLNTRPVYIKEFSNDRTEAYYTLTNRLCDISNHLYGDPASIA
nr:MAG: RNA-dependent RNA polymerase [Riboviria sp.]